MTEVPRIYVTLHAVARLKQRLLEVAVPPDPIAWIEHAVRAGWERREVALEWGRNERLLVPIPGHGWAVLRCSLDGAGQTVLTIVTDQMRCEAHGCGRWKRQGPRRADPVPQTPPKPGRLPRPQVLRARMKDGRTVVFRSRQPGVLESRQQELMRKGVEWILITDDAS